MKSFYDLDYIIEINESRIEQYNAAYQKVLERLTNIIIIYSAISIFLIPILQYIFLCNGPINRYLCSCFFSFVALFIISLIFTVRLIIPVEVPYLSNPKRYYEEYRLEYEKLEHGQPEVEKLLKASYINELEINLKRSEKVFRRKSSFYYNALMYGLLSAVPYLLCFGFYVSQKEDQPQKIEVVNQEKNCNLNKISDMSGSKNADTSTKPAVTTQLPGVNNAQVIPSSPIMIKENSHTPSTKVKK